MVGIYKQTPEQIILDKRATLVEYIRSRHPDHITTLVGFCKECNKMDMAVQDIDPTQPIPCCVCGEAMEMLVIPLIEMAVWSESMKNEEDLWKPEHKPRSIWDPDGGEA